MRVDWTNPLLLVIVVMALLGVAWRVGAHFFSEEARWERRRRRSNAPIASKSNRPSVRLSVRTRKKRRK